MRLLIKGTMNSQFCFISRVYHCFDILLNILSLLKMRKIEIENGLECILQEH